MKGLIESTKKLQGDIDKCISILIHARQYHDKIEEAGAVLDMERLLVASAQQLQCVVERLEGAGSMIEWGTGEPLEPGAYLVTLDCGVVTTDNYSLEEEEWQYWPGEIIAWQKLIEIKPYEEKEG